MLFGQRWVWLPLPSLLVLRSGRRALRDEEVGPHRHEHPAGALVVLGIALVLRSPVPSSIGQVRDHPGLAFRCPLTGVDVEQL